MNVPLPTTEESTKMEVSIPKDDAMEGDASPRVATKRKEMTKKYQDDAEEEEDDNEGEDDSSSSGDDVDGDGDGDVDDKAVEGTTSNNTTPDGSALSIPLRYTKSGRKRSIPFPVRLMTVLSDPKFHHIIEWLPSGKSFVIYKPKVFATDILPSRFKSAKYSSFTRKLHRWGFVRHFRGGDSGAFFHPDFQKGRLDLAESMTCGPQTKNVAPSKKVRKQKLLQSSKSSPAIGTNTRKSGIASFRNVMGHAAGTSAIASATTNTLRQNPAQLLGIPGDGNTTGTSSMHHLPLLSNLGMSSNIANNNLPGFSPSTIPNMLNNGRATLNQYNSTGMMRAASSPNSRLSGKYSGMNFDATTTSNDLVAQHQQQVLLKARLDVAIKEELTRIELARLSKERLATANAVHRYNALLQHQQRQRNSNNHHSMLLGTLPSVNDGLIGSLSSSPFFGSSPSPSLVGGSNHSAAFGAVNNPQVAAAASLAPVLGQLSRAELEQYALAMSTRNVPQASQRPPSTNPRGVRPPNSF